MFGNMLMGAAGASLAAGGYSVGNSIVLDDGSSQRLNWTPGTAATSDKIHTVSVWFKLGNLGTNRRFINAEVSGGTGAYQLGLNTSDKLIVHPKITSGSEMTSTRVLRDPHAWQHLCVSFDTTQSVEADRYYVALNGEDISSEMTGTKPPQNMTMKLLESGVVQTIGAYKDGTYSSYMDGYLSEFVVIDGAKLDATSFGEYDINGVWRPIDVTEVATDRDQIPALTSNSAPSPYAVTASSEDGAGTEGYRMFANGSSSWRTASGAGGVANIVIDVGSANAFAATSLVLTGTSDAATRCPTNFTFEGSNTGSFSGEETVLYTGSSLSWSASETKTFTFSNTTSFRYYKLDVTSTSGGTYVEIEEGEIRKQVTGDFGTNGFYLPFTNSNALGLDTQASATAAQAYTEFQCNFDGSDAATSATDASKNSATITFSGNAQLDTAQQKFGTASLLLDGTGDYVSIPDASYLEIGSKDFTIDCWIRFSTVPTNQETIVSKWTGTGNQRSFNFAFEGSTSNLIIQLSGDGSSTALNKQESWSPSQDTWYHVAVERTGGNVHLYVNGTQLGSGTANSTNIYNGSATFMVGALNAGAAQNFTGHVDEVRFINGYGAYQGSNFTVPTTAYATPPVSNTFTPSGSPTQSSDTPTNNSATLTTIDGSGATFSNGNLVVGSNTTNSYKGGTGCIGLAPGSGSWYVEALCTGATGANKEYVFGAATNDTNKSVAGYFPGSATYSNDDEHGYYSGSGGIVYNGSSSTGSVGIYGDGDTVALRFDMDVTTPTCKFYVNDTLKHTANLTVGKTYYPHFNTQDLNLTFTVNFGATSFTYTLPTGHLAINTTNLYTNAAPAIEDGTAYFQATTYTGTGSAREVNQSGNTTFQPDWVWVKERGGANEHRLIDVVRGATETLYLGGAMTTAAEATESTGVTSFDSDGFSVGTGGGYNNLNDTYVGWQWKGDGTSGSSNTDGSITSTVNVNDTAGFSIGKYVGSGSNGATIGHGLSAVPEFIIVKNRDQADGWVIYHPTPSATDELRFTALAATPNSAIWNNTEPTSTVFSVGTSHSTNASTENYIFYAWRSIPGYSAFGSYEGNGSSNGPVIMLDFSPAYIMFKNIDASAQWAIYDNQRDPYNAADKMLFADSTGAENVGNLIDWLANGVKIRGTSAAYNASNTYIYFAFAENPFAGSSPATAR